MPGNWLKVDLRHVILYDYRDSVVCEYWFGTPLSRTDHVSVVKNYKADNYCFIEHHLRFNNIHHVVWDMSEDRKPKIIDRTWLETGGQ